MIYKVFCAVKYRLYNGYICKVTLNTACEKVYIFLASYYYMGMRSKENSAGAWAFFIGVVIAIVIGISTILIPLPVVRKYSNFIYLILVALGIVVGYSINTTGKDSQTFLITGTIIVIVSKFGMDSVTSSLIGIDAGFTASSIFASLLALFVTATIVVALKTVFGLAKV